MGEKSKKSKKSKTDSESGSGSSRRTSRRSTREKSPAGADGAAAGPAPPAAADMQAVLERLGSASTLSNEKVVELIDEVRLLSRSPSQLSSSPVKEEPTSPLRTRAATTSEAESGKVVGGLVNSQVSGSAPTTTAEAESTTATTTTATTQTPAAASSSAANAPPEVRTAGARRASISSDGSSASMHASHAHGAHGVSVGNTPSVGLKKFMRNVAKLGKQDRDKYSSINYDTFCSSDSEVARPSEDENGETRRDMYGYEIAQENLGKYGAYMEMALTHFVIQLEAFERLTMKYRAELLGGEDDAADGKSNSSRKSGIGSLFQGGIARDMSRGCREELLRLVPGGIPPKYRTLLWPVMCGQRPVMQMAEGIYQRLLDDHVGEETQAILQIARDIPRTFPSNINAFSTAALTRVLTAYSWRDPDVGYCQSMNFVTAGFLTFLSEEESFWMLCFVADKILPEYFGEAVIGVLADAQILGDLIRDRMPDVYKHFRKIMFDLRLFVSQWFMTLYSYVLPPECTFRVWDILLLKGPVVLFEMALGILTLHQERLLKTRDAPDVVLTLQAITAAQFDIIPLLKAFTENQDPLDPTAIVSQRRSRIHELLQARRITNS